MSFLQPPRLRPPSDPSPSASLARGPLGPHRPPPTSKSMMRNNQPSACVLMLDCSGSIGIMENGTTWGPSSTYGGRETPGLAVSLRLPDAPAQGRKSVACACFRRRSTTVFGLAPPHGKTGPVVTSGGGIEKVKPTKGESALARRRFMKTGRAPDRRAAGGADLRFHDPSQPIFLRRRNCPTLRPKERSPTSDRRLRRAGSRQDRIFPFRNWTPLFLFFLSRGLDGEGGELGVSHRSVSQELSRKTKKRPNDARSLTKQREMLRAGKLQMTFRDGISP